MEKLVLNMKSLLEMVFEADKYFDRVLIGSVGNLPRTNHYYPKIYYVGGEYDTYNGIEHLMYALYQHGQSGVKVDMEKTINKLKQDIGENSFFSPVTLEVVKKENFEKTIDSDEDCGTMVVVDKEESLKDVPNLPDMATIEESAKEMRAAEFKEWLKKYLLTFETFDFKVDTNIGVKKLIKQLEDKLNG